jgi:hypothetical protein
MAQQTIISRIINALTWNVMAKVTAIPISTSINRWIRDSFGPEVVAMWDARWQSQSAKPAQSHSGK